MNSLVRVSFAAVLVALFACCIVALPGLASAEEAEGAAGEATLASESVREMVAPVLDVDDQSGNTDAGDVAGDGLGASADACDVAGDGLGASVETVDVAGDGLGASAGKGDADAYGLSDSRGDCEGDPTIAASPECETGVASDSEDRSATEGDDGLEAVAAAEGMTSSDGAASVTPSEGELSDGMIDDAGRGDDADPVAMAETLTTQPASSVASAETQGPCASASNTAVIPATNAAVAGQPVATASSSSKAANAAAATAATAKASHGEVMLEQQAANYQYAYYGMDGSTPRLYVSDENGKKYTDASWGSNLNERSANLKQIIKLFISSSVENLERIVYHPDNDTKIYLNTDLANLTTISFLHSKSTGKSNVKTIAKSCFGKYNKLTTIIGLKDTQLTTIGDYAFSGTEITRVTLPSTVTTIGEHAFDDCASLAKVNGLEETKVSQIGAYAFEGCGSLTSVSLPSTCTLVGANAFANCTRLNSVTLNQGLKSIAAQSFMNCLSLKTITIPSTVTSIGNKAFFGCTILDSVNMKGQNPPALGSDVFYQYINSRYTSRVNVIYIPRYSMSAYKSAKVWKTFYDDLLRYPAQISIKRASVTLTQSVYNWTGKQIKPMSNVVVTCDGQTLVHGVDYWLSYKNNVKQGIASVVVHGKDNYIDAKGVSFRIGGKTIALPNGYFEVCKSLKADTHLSVNGGNANVRERNYTCNERFQVVKCANGAYRLVNVGTGKALGVTDSGNVAESAWANKWAQQWIPEKVEDTSWIQWRNHKTGKFLCMPAAYSAGTNVATATTNGKGSQQWLLRKAVPYVTDGNVRRIAMASAPNKVVGLSGDVYVAEAGTNANLDTKVVAKEYDDGTSSDIVAASGTLEDNMRLSGQQLIFHRNANGYYTLVVHRGNFDTGALVLHANDDGNVVFEAKKGSTGTLAQQWAIAQMKTADGYEYYFINAKTGKALTTRDNSSAYHANVMVSEKASAIRWKIVK